MQDDRLERKLDSILVRLSKIESSLERVERDILDVKQGISKMGGHIEFVEDVYERVKRPLYKVMSYVSGKAIGAPGEAICETEK